jgi:hypothetical protein
VCDGLTVALPLPFLGGGCWRHVEGLRFEAGAAWVCGSAGGPRVNVDVMVSFRVAKLQVVARAFVRRDFGRDLDFSDELSIEALVLSIVASGVGDDAGSFVDVVN